MTLELAWAGGAAHLAAAWIGWRALGSSRTFLAPGLGFGLVSFSLLIPLWWAGRITPIASAILLACAAAAVEWVRRLRPLPKSADAGMWTWAISVLAALLTVPGLIKSPHGAGQDAWAIWRLKARLLHESPVPWDILGQPVLAFSHPDYPLAYPLSILWGWICARTQTPVSAWTISLLTAAAAAGLLAGALRRQGRWVAAAAGLFLVSTPGWTGMCGSQYADTLIGYYGLAAAVLLSRSLEGREDGGFAWAGFFAGLAVFTKNEGWLTLAAAAAGLWAGRARSGRPVRTTLAELARLAAGALPGAAAAVAVKARVGVPADVLTWRGAADNLFSADVLARSGHIASALVREILNENTWVYAWPFIAVVTILSARRILRSPSDRAVAVCWLVPAAGYAGVYLATPLDLGWLLPASLGRLLVHLFPVASFLAFRNLRGCLDE